MNTHAIILGVLFFIFTLASSFSEGSCTLGTWIEEIVNPDTFLTTGKYQEKWTHNPAAGIIGQVYEIKPNSLLEGAELRVADLNVVDLRGANLRGANLSSAFLIQANLAGADLSDADLTGARLWGADLSGANLSGAKLSGADLRYVNLSEAKLNDVIYINPILDPKIAELKSELETVKAELDAKPTIEKLQDARNGSIVINVSNEEVTISFNIEESDDLKTWKVTGEKITKTIQLKSGKKFYRFALD